MEKSFFFNAKKTGDTYDRVYKAEEFASYFAEFIGNGVYPNPSTGLQVVENSEASMTTVLKPGSAFINGYGYKNTGDIVFEHKVADGVLNRKDAIFVRFDNAGRAIGAIKMEGNPGAEAVAPRVVRTVDYFDLCVAVVNINAGITKITQDLIEDTRMNTEVCGIVHAIVEQIDSTALYLQVQKDLENFRTVSQAEFDKWFETLKNVLSEEAAGNLLSMIKQLRKHVVYKYAATLRFDAWGGQGPYSQTVALEPIDGGPAVSSNTKFYSPPMCGQVSDSETRQKLLEALALINNSNCTLGERQITVSDVKEKPTTDIEVIWVLKEGGV